MGAPKNFYNAVDLEKMGIGMMQAGEEFVPNDIYLDN